MKKILLVISLVFLLAAGCNSTMQNDDTVNTSQSPQNTANTQKNINTQTESASSKIYTNTTMGYQFEYPSIVTPQASDNTQENKVTFTDKNNVTYSIIASKSKLTGNLVSDITSDNYGDRAVISSYNQTSVSGLGAYSYKNGADTLLMKNGLLYEIIATSGAKSEPVDPKNETYLQIIETFKFN